MISDKDKVKREFKEVEEGEKYGYSILGEWILITGDNMEGIFNHHEIT